MTAEVITVLALVAGIAWLGLIMVAAFRNRGGEEIAPNLQPGIDDQQLETRRLEKGQKVAIAFSAFLAIALPLYFLGEPARQAGFVEEFDEASIARGASVAAEFGCFDCHGPAGSGGVASAVERRSGVSVEWVAPRLDDVFFRYSDDEVNFWVTYGRANTPMPAWGLAGGGPMNEHQVVDVINYLKTLQRSQQEVLNEMPGLVQSALRQLEDADAAVDDVIIRQEQVVAEIDQAPEDFAFISFYATEARMLLDNAGLGQDTDADGLSDTTEERLSVISADLVDFFRAFDPVRFDPETPDAEKVNQALAQLRAAAVRDPVMNRYINLVNQALEDDGEDTDGDGVSDSAETQINAILTQAANSTVPAGLSVVTLSPTDPASVGGESDMRTATRLVGAIESVAIGKRVLVENEDRIRPQEEAGLAFLRQARRDRLWEVDINGVAAAMGTDTELASRAVGLFQANCARCHTSGFSAGMAFAQEIGSGGFGPSLADGRPTIQFGTPGDGEDDMLADFLINGSVAQAPYGLNGVGSGRMPGFGSILSGSDIELLARYLRSGNLSGKE